LAKDSRLKEAGLILALNLIEGVDAFTTVSFRETIGERSADADLGSCDKATEWASNDCSVQFGAYRRYRRRDTINPLTLVDSGKAHSFDTFIEPRWLNADSTGSRIRVD
jgi:hypothetical protein